MRKQIFTEKGVQPGGPYSQAIVAEGAYVFVAGQGPADPETGDKAVDLEIIRPLADEGWIRGLGAFTEHTIDRFLAQLSVLA